MNDKNSVSESAAKAEALQTRRPAFLKERNQFRALMMTNPNYFGNLVDSPFPVVQPIKSNTTYEDIACLGFNPKNEHLEAIVRVKQATGYGGGICSVGSHEYVRFYLSMDNGATWSDQGLASFIAHNIPEGTVGPKELHYAVALATNPPNRFCWSDNTHRMRAILSWNVQPPPNDPDYSPVWGEVQDANIQVAARRIIIFKDLINEKLIQLSPEIAPQVDLNQVVETNEPMTLKAAELAKLYKGKVELHRFALPELNALMAEPTQLDGAIHEAFKDFLPDINIDLGSLAGLLFPNDGNTTYEQLTCIGLNNNNDTLIGTVVVKLSNGYSGGPCTAGSKEYVSFWADFNNNGTYETFLGTTSVTVHDIASMPAGGLSYAVQLPIDLTTRRKLCSSGANVVPVRAILSWQTPFNASQVNDVPVWGNRKDALVHITPGLEVPPGMVVAEIAVLGGIPTQFIGNSSGRTTTGAYFSDNSLPAGQGRPFGLRVNVKGRPYVGYKYTVEVRKNGTLPWTKVVNEFRVTHVDGTSPIIPHKPDSSGLFDFLPWEQNIANLLGVWDSGEDGLWDVRLAIYTGGGALVSDTVHVIEIDNTAPHAELEITTGAGNCGQFTPGDVIEGTFVAQDAYFESFSFTVLPSSSPIFTTPGQGNTPNAPGSVWSLDTTNMTPCGYVVVLTVNDKAILNSSDLRHQTQETRGLCLL
jgi:hypothetical protein